MSATEYDDTLDLIDAALVNLRAALESEIAAHSNTKMLLDAAMTTANAERARADLAERKLVAMRKEHNNG